MIFIHVYIFIVAMSVQYFKMVRLLEDLVCAKHLDFLFKDIFHFLFSMIMLKL